MLSLSMSIQVPGEVLNLSRELQIPIDELSDAAANYLADAYQYYVVAVGAVKSGELLQSIHVQEGPSSDGGDRLKHVVATANHAAVVEYGWIERGKGQLSYPGRFPAEKATMALLDHLDRGGLVDALAWRMKK
jgi:hypothetical protein